MCKDLQHSETWAKNHHVQQAQIVTLHGESNMKRKICEKLNCLKTAMHNAVGKYQTDVNFL